MKSILARLAIAAGLLVMSSLDGAVTVRAQNAVAMRGLIPGQAVNLFDGYSLDGWSRRDGSPHPGWDIEDGALHRKSGGGDLYYRDALGDFELYFQWRIAVGGNSGLKYRVRDFDGSWLGCEYQLLDDTRHSDANKTAGLYDVIDPPDFTPIVLPAVWNYSRIVVCGNHIEHWLNGVQTVSVNVGSSRWKSAVADSKFASTGGFGENRIGRLFLQDHGDEVWFRNLVLVPLDCPEWIVSTQSTSDTCCGASSAGSVLSSDSVQRLRFPMLSSLRTCRARPLSRFRCVR